MATWDRKIYELQEYPIASGQSPFRSALFVFGFNPDIDGVEETIWVEGGNYPWASSPFTARVISTSASDTSGGTGANTVIVEGLDENYNQVSQSVALNGTTPVLLTGSWLRVNNAYVTLSGSNAGAVGTVRVQNSAGTSTYANLSEGNQSQVAAYTVPAGYNLYLDDVNFTVALSQSNKFVRVKFVERDYGSNTFRTRYTNVIQSNQLISKFEYPKLFKEKTDIECRAFSNTTNNAVAASFQGILVDMNNDGTY